MAGQQHIQAAQTELFMLASIKNESINTIACLWIWVKQAKLMVNSTVLIAILLALNASAANKCQHKFQTGLSFQ